VGLKFLQNRGNPDAFEPVPTGAAAVPTNDAGEDIYTVEVEGKSYTVTVANGGDISGIVSLDGSASESAVAVPATGGEPVNAPLAGTVVKVLVKPGQKVAEGETILILEAMKMETSVSAPSDGTIVEIKVQSGDSCGVGDPLVTLA
jgi:oxaloacetate decarboxylase alpha subunit